LDTCPGPPFWRPISAKERFVNVGANRRIENHYKDANGDEGVLVGSDFVERPGFEIRLPHGAPNKRFGDYALANLRGVWGGQRKPDIIDFRKRSMYEIKPIYSYLKDKRKCIEQQASLFRDMAGLVREFVLAGGDQDPWSPENSKWKPDTVLTIDRDHKICTAYTDKAYQDFPGMIVYEVWERVSNEKKCAEAAALVVTAHDEAYDSLLPSAKQLKAMVGAYSSQDPEFVILAPAWLDELIKKSRQTRAERVLEKAYGGLPPFLDKRNPIGQFRDLSRKGPFAGQVSESTQRLIAGTALVVSVTGLLILVIVGGVALFLPEAAAGAAAGGGGTVIELTTAAKAGAVLSETFKNAAGIILIAGLVGATEARADTPTYSQTGAIRLVPLCQIAEYKGVRAALSSGMCIANAPGSPPSILDDIDIGDTVFLDSLLQVVIAKVRLCP
jgi:hypothetical protein